jgi:hypothetical protein
MARWASTSLEQAKPHGRSFMAEINSDEKVVVAKSSINVANIIIAIAVLIAVLGLLKYIGASPF